MCWLHYSRDLKIKHEGNITANSVKLTDIQYIICSTAFEMVCFSLFE